MELPIKMQSTLILGLKGPDDRPAPNVKKITRWLRGLSFRPGDPRNVHEFMGERPERIMDRSPAYREIEYLPLHYFGHLLHSLEVVAYKHPDFDNQVLAFGLMADLCSILHLIPEDDDKFNHRLRSLDNEWPDGEAPEKYEEVKQS